MMNSYRQLWVIILPVFFCVSSSAQSQVNVKYRLKPAGPVEAPVILQGHPDAAGNKNGFEGGTVFREGKDFHLFVTEEMKGWSQTRTGHWESRDGKKWRRLRTVQSPAAQPEDPRYSIWSPMPVYNPNEDRWNLFYVGYETERTIHGRVFRAMAGKRGRKGLEDTFNDVAGTVIAFTDSVRNDWEGVQGTDSFYPFRAGDKWLAFYGSSDAASYWYVGLAEADSLEGCWKRIIGPPVFRNAENPIVISLGNGTFFCVYDDLTRLNNDNRIGYAWSADGLNWESASLEIPLPAPVTNIRTPQGMIPVGDGAYWIYYTGNTASRFDVVARVKVKIEPY
ncbi:hypothetical protein GCM10023091_22120 [Ravibacter arvi]|uniref:Uncharacterized protein n=2 Tax=Ravibacter arvi TaxID=2051041 RepID=A0ABP8LZJ0_9BACT